MTSAPRRIRVERNTYRRANGGFEMASSCLRDLRRLTRARFGRMEA